MKIVFILLCLISIIYLIYKLVDYKLTENINKTFKNKRIWKIKNKKTK